MSDDIAIKVENVSKSFKLPHEKHGSVKNAFVNIFRGKTTYEKQEALKDISLEIKKGEFFGIVGRNGSGKSTLLKLLAGIYSPDKGAIQVNGKLTPFIELGVGFNPELTGRENVFLNGALLGFSREEMYAMYDEIVEFAELEKFMDQKLKNYSSGMQVRLAFSIAIRAQSEILVLDEVLAVGDTLFQKKCYDYFKQLKKERRTVVFVSHDTNALLEYCSSGILINDGVLMKTSSSIDKIVETYNENLLEIQRQLRQTSTQTNKSKDDTHTKPIRVSSTKIDSRRIQQKNEIKISVKFIANEILKSPVYGITVIDSAGYRVFTSNTLWAKKKTNNVGKKEEINVIWHIPNSFNNGTFYVTPAVADSSGLINYDVSDEAASFEVINKTHTISFINVDHKIEII